jgi:hypothetical protein
VGNHQALLASAQQLRSAELYDPKDCSRLLKSLVITLTQDEWHDAAPSVLSGWKVLVLREEGRLLVAPYEDALLDRLLRNSDPEILDALFVEAAKDPKNAARVTLRVDRLFGEAVSAAEFEASQQAAVIFAFMRRNEFRHAQEYLSKVQWPAGGAGNAKTSALRVEACVDICERAERGFYEIVPIIRSWSAAHAIPSKPDSAAQTAVRSSLEAITCRVVKPGGVRAGLPACAKLVEDSVGVPHAEEFWDRLLEIIARNKAETFEDRMEASAPFLNMFSSKFKDSKFECRYWVDLSADIPKDRSALSRRIACFSHALQVAPDDATRADLAQQLAGEHEGLADFAGARHVLEGTSTKVSAAAAKEALAGALRSLKRKEELENLRRREEDQRIERERAKGRLSFMKDELARARKANKPPEDIQSLEGVVRNLEREVGE